MEANSDKDLAREIFNKMLERNEIGVKDLLELQQNRSGSNVEDSEMNYSKVLKRVKPNETVEAEDIGLDDIMQCERPAKPKFRSKADTDGLEDQERIERMKKTLESDSGQKNFALSTLVGFIPDDEDSNQGSGKKKPQKKGVQDVINWRKQQYEEAKEKYEKFIPVRPADPHAPPMSPEKQSTSPAKGQVRAKEIEEMDLDDMLEQHTT